jgi:hypothetical protein
VGTSEADECGTGGVLLSVRLDGDGTELIGATAIGTGHGDSRVGGQLGRKRRTRGAGTWVEMRQGATGEGVMGAP